MSKKKKGFSLPPGEVAEIEFTTSWNSAKREVVIMTENGPITLNEKSEFFINISADNVDPIKIRVTPDFENRKLNFVEVIDPSFKSDKKKGNIIFTGAEMSADEPSLDEYLRSWDKNIEKMGNQIKKYKRRKYILMVLLVILMFINMYMFIIVSGLLRYVYVLVIMIPVYAMFNLWKANNDIYKEYEKYKELREEAFGIVKEK